MGLPAQVVERLDRVGVSTLAELAELGVSGVAALRLSVGDLRRTLTVLAAHGLALRETPRAQSRRVTASLESGVLRRERDKEIVLARGRGDTLQDIGARFGIGRERVRQILVEQQAVDAERARTARAQRDVVAAWQRRDEVLEVFRASGSDPEAIAEQLELLPAVVGLLLEMHATGADRAAWRLARAVTGPTKAHPQHSDADVIDAIKRVAKACGRAPTEEDYDRIAQASALPSRETVKNRFGGWNAALLAAGQTPRATQRTYERPWTEERCLEAIRKLAGELGELPTQREYDRLSRGRPDLPSMGTVRKTLGTWSHLALRLESEQQSARSA